MFSFSYSIQSHILSLLFSPVLLLFIIASELAYNPLYQVLVCKEYQIYIIPDITSIKQYLQVYLYYLLD